MLILSGVFLSYVCFRMICAAAVSCVSSLSLLSVVVVFCCCCGVLLPSNGCVLQDIVGHHHQEEYFRASGGARAEGGAPGDRGQKYTRHKTYCIRVRQLAPSF